MPIYEYQCEQCGHRGEEMRRLADPPLTECPQCGGPYKKLISAPAFQFKGSGWYVTDYARGGGKGEGAKSEGGGAGESSAGEAKSDGTKSDGAKSEKAASATDSTAKADKPAAS